MRLLLTTLLLCTIVIGCITPQRGPKKRYARAVREHKTFDAIIVPGIGYEGAGWDSVMKARVIWSWLLYKNGLAKNIIYSGAAVYTPYIEAKVMGLYAQALGIPAEHIFYDTLAKHSTENVYYSYLVAQRQGFRTIALASDPFQSLLLRSFTKKRFGTPIYHLPFITDSLGVYNHLNPDINPAPARVNGPHQSIEERETFWQRFRGTLGKDIPWEKHEGRELPAL